MRLPATAKWIGLALLGLAIAAAVGIAASNLASQQIGIASESITAGDRLAPAVRSASRQATPSGRGQQTTTTTTPPTTTTSPPPDTTTTAPTAPPAPPPTTPGNSGEPGDDHGSGGHGADD